MKYIISLAISIIIYLYALLDFVPFIDRILFLRIGIPQSDYIVLSIISIVVPIIITTISYHLTRSIWFSPISFLASLLFFVAYNSMSGLPNLYNGSGIYNKLFGDIVAILVSLTITILILVKNRKFG